MAELNIKTEIAVIKNVVENLTKNQAEYFKKVFKILEGNGSVGIVTQTELNKSAIKRIWWLIGIGIPVTITIIGIIIKVFL